VIIPATVPPQIAIRHPVNHVIEIVMRAGKEGLDLFFFGRSL